MGIRFRFLIGGILGGLVLAFGVWATEMPTLPPTANLVEPLLMLCSSGPVTRYWVTEGASEKIKWGLLKRGETIVAIWKLNEQENVHELWARFSKADIRHFTRDELFARYPNGCDLVDEIPPEVSARI